MKKTVKLVLVSIAVIILIATSIRIVGNKINEAYNKGFNDAINNAVISVVKVAQDLYEVRIELQGELYVHLVDSIEEEEEVYNNAY